MFAYLDVWMSFQMVMEMGNSRARAVYEANLPDNYRRPQTDSYPLSSIFEDQVLVKFPWYFQYTIICNNVMYLGPRQHLPANNFELRHEISNNVAFWHE